MKTIVKKVVLVLGLSLGLFFTACNDKHGHDNHDDGHSHSHQHDSL